MPSFGNRFHILVSDYTMSDTEVDILDVLHELIQLERAFYGTIRFFDSASRSHLVAGHLRNSGAILTLMREYMRAEPNRTTNMVFNIPLGNLDLSGNFFDPVPVLPTQQQITTATERNVTISETNCAICQDSVTSATRIRACGHCFHPQCIEQWFSVNTRCPVCRHDIRENLQTPHRQATNEGRRMHADEE